MAKILNQPFDLELIRQWPTVAQLHFRREMTSTSDVCKTLLREFDSADPCQFPLLVLTQLQTSGRGQLARKWWSPAGALTFTWVRNCSLENVTDGLASLAAALSVAEAIETTSPSVVATIKWPNDVFVAGKKIAGILIESMPFEIQGKFQDENQCVQLIGIGINSSNTMAAAPEEIASMATSLYDETKAEVNLQDLLSNTIDRLQHNLVDIDDVTRELLLEDCAKRSICSIGSSVNVETPQGTIEGKFHGFDRSGYLLVEINGQLQTIVSGRLQW